MANRIYEVEAPDGTILEIEGPDGASEADLFKAAGELWKPPAQEAPKERSWGEAASDVKNLVGRGLLGTYAAPVDYFRPELDTFGKEKEDFNKALSPTYRANKQKVTKAIEAKEQEGFLPGLGEAFKQYATNPDVAIGTAAEAMPSLATSAMIAAGTAASGGTAVLGLALTAMWNAIQNGGQARKDAYDEVKKDELKKGKSPEEAHATAMWESLGPQAVGSFIGSFTGKSGVEEVFAGATKKGAKEAFKKMVKEWGGEQAEEVLPKVTTNYAVDKPLTAGLPEVIAATTAGAAPGTAVAGVGSMVGPEPTTPVDPALARELRGETDPETDIVEPNPVTEELPFQTLTGGAQGGILSGTEMEVDENGMPIDVAGSLELQQTERGEVGVQGDMFASEPKDLFEALNQEAKRNRERNWEELQNMGPPEPEHLIAERKRRAFEEAEKINALWKDATTSEMFKNADWKALEQIVANGTRDTAMSEALAEAFGNPDPMVDERPLPPELPDMQNSLPVQSIGDPLLNTYGAPITTTPAQDFLNLLRKKGGDFAKIWANERSELKAWAQNLFGPLLSEDSIRGDVARRKLLEDAAFDQAQTEKAVHNDSTRFDGVPKLKTKVNIDPATGAVKSDKVWTFNNMNRVQRSSRTTTWIRDTASKQGDAAGLSFTSSQKWRNALKWVSTVLPHLTRNGEYILVLDPKRAGRAWAQFQAFEKTGLKVREANQQLARMYPELKVILDDIGHLTPWYLKQASDANNNGLMYPFEYADSKKGGKGAYVDRHYPIVIINKDYVDKSPIVNIIGTLVHELVHAKHYRRPGTFNSKVRPHLGNIHEEGLTGPEVLYQHKWTEQKARQAQETARMKYAEMYAEALAKKGDKAGLQPLYNLDEASFPGWKVPASVRAADPKQRSMGAVGPSRMPTDASPRTPVVDKEWPSTTPTGDPKHEAIGVKSINAGVKLYGNSFFRRLSNAANISTTQFLEHLGTVSEDIWTRFGFRSGTYRGSSPTLLNPTTGDFVYAHVNQKFVQHAANEHANNAKSRKAWENLEAHYSADSVKVLGKVDIGMTQRKSKRLAGAKAFAKDTKIVLWFEKNPDQWFDGQNYYPTVQQMVDQGLSLESAKVWRGVMDQYEQLWDTLEDAVGVAGRHAVARVPGYMPHTTIGQYKARAVSIDKNGKTVKYHAEIGAATEKEAKRSLALLQKYFAGQKVSFVIVPPEPGKYDVGSVLEGLRKARDLAGNIEGLKKLAEIIEGNAARGVITHALDRGSVARFGHTLERATRFESDFGMDLRGQMDAVRGFREYVKAVNGYAERVKFVRDTLGPLDMAGALDMPNLRDAIFDNFKDYVGIGNVNKVDIAIKSAMVKAGWDPTLIDHYVSNAQSGIAFFYLAGNVPFYVVNSVQATASFPILFAKQAEMRLQGEKKIPNFSTAVNRGMRRMKNIWTEDSRMADPALRWAEEHGYLDPQAHEAMQPTGKLPRDPITAGIDRKTRQIAFVIGYEFYRQAYDHETSLEKAGAFSKEVAVPYEKSVGKPSILNRLPVIGQAATLFTTYPMHILSMLENQLRMIYAGVKEGDRVAAAQALTSMVTYVGLQAAMFGLMVMPFASFLNFGADELNKILGRPVIPNLHRLSRILDSALDTNGMAQFGIISSLTGYDVSSSAQGVAPGIPTATARAIKSLFEAVLLSGGMFIGKTTTQDWYEFIRTMPTQHRGILEKFIRDYPETMAQEHFREKGEARTALDQFVMTTAGIRSIQEKSKMTTEQLLKTDQQIIARRFASLTERMKDKQRPSEQDLKELEELAKEFKVDPNTVLSAWVSFVQTKDLSPDLRRAMRANSMTGAVNYQRYLKETSMEPTRPQ